MSELSVGQLKGLTINDNVITVPSGHKFVAPGHVLQVVSTFKSDTAASTSTSFVDIAGMSVSVTPISNNSKFFILVDGVAGYSTGSNSVLINLVRNSTNIAQGTGQTFNMTRMVYPANAGIWWPVAFNFLDSPATSLPITYKLQFRTDGSGTSFWGRRGVTADFSSSSTITVMEIAQ
jgi:hypothetical protein